MEHPPTAYNYIAPEPPQFPAPPHFPGPPRSVDLSPLEFVLALIAIITIPALIYTFFFSIKCPPAPFRRRHRRDVDSSDVLSVNNENNPTSADAKEVVADVKYKKETHVKEIGSDCPVCLSVFSDGEDVKQLSVCKHSFHASCINTWLNSHSNCPVCRASVGAGKRSNNGPSTVSASRDSDLQQGLPDAASLV